MIYLDNSATTRVLPAAADVARQAMTEDFFNASSAYAPAVSLEKRVEAARARLGAVLCRQPEELVYTSGGTESNNTAIFGALSPLRGKHRIITCMTEHPSVYGVFTELEKRPDLEVVYIGVDQSGAANMEELASVLTADTALVSLMQVNNETGAITDLSQAYTLIRKAAPEALFHVDGVQAFCKLPFAQVPCDLYTISAHKFHAPKGIGALMIQKGVRFGGGLIGGGQERGIRSGTTNAPGILGMDAALMEYRAHQQEWIASMRACKLRLSAQLSSLPDGLINGPSIEEGAGHILNVSFLGIRGEVLLNALSQREIYVSTGSACSAHKRGKNRVLTAMGVTGPRQDGAIRFSFSPFNTLEEMDVVSNQIGELIGFLRKYKRR